MAADQNVAPAANSNAAQAAQKSELELGIEALEGKLAAIEAKAAADVKALEAKVVAMAKHYALDVTKFF